MNLIILLPSANKKSSVQALNARNKDTIELTLKAGSIIIIRAHMARLMLGQSTFIFNSSEVRAKCDSPRQLVYHSPAIKLGLCLLGSNLVLALRSKLKTFISKSCFKMERIISKSLFIEELAKSIRHIITVQHLSPYASSL